MSAQETLGSGLLAGGSPSEETGGEGRWSAPESSPPSHVCVSATVCVLPQSYMAAGGQVAQEALVSIVWKVN